MSLYHEAADVLAGSASVGGSLKSRVFGRTQAKSPPNQLYALVLETCKWSAVIKEIVEAAELLKHERKLTPVLSLLLVHDLLLSKGGVALPQSHGLRASVERHKARLKSELTRARLRRKAPSLEVLREQVDRAAAGEEASFPRWVRVNGIRSSIEEQLETTFKGFARAESVGDVISKPGRLVYIDPHVPNLLAVTAGHDLSRTEAYTSGKIILQDKASCFPAYLLDPHSEDGDVIDACAAPGNKTTHLAAIIHQHSPEFESAPQTIFAFEKDKRRAQTLEKMVRIAGSKTVTRIGSGQDFLQVDPSAEDYRNVTALLLDPSCSGSGIVGRDSMPELHLPSVPGLQTGSAAAAPGKGRKRKLDQTQEKAENIIRDDDGNEVIVQSEKDLVARLEALSNFQLALLLHAFRFPAARKVTYSTCSVHVQENEAVVVAALRSEVARSRGWRILPRDKQVRGMNDWPVRGKVEACDGDQVVAEGCIRSHKEDGLGVMGFFVAGFVRGDVDEDWRQAHVQDAADEGPYVRDDAGRIVRDLTGMPMLKTTGMPIQLEAREEKGEECGCEESEATPEDEDEWDGIGD
ncbi:hypothetical protein HIM_01694 [Hirsutella minnesotensis 3608]|nr:hypothetical protein HIM_01694 [Hirsutella minnesotensis 3608]